MLQLDLPHLNVLTKIDTLALYAPSLPFNLDFYTEGHDLEYLLPHLDAELGPTSSKFSALNAAILDLVGEFGLVGFETLAVEDKKSMMNLLQVVDRAGGYAFGTAEGANDTVWQVAVREGMGLMDVRDVQERWVDAREDFDDMERRRWEEEAKAREVMTGQGRGEDGAGGEIGGDEDEGVDEEAAAKGSIPDSGIKIVRRS